MASMTAPPGDGGPLPKRPCALLWDESLLWGVMARRALIKAGLPFDLIRAEEVRGGSLTRYGMLFIPGGWASHKISALGEPGKDEIRRFVAAGGSYLGICGGAGMATQKELGLLPITRKSPRERVPSFSGPLHLSCSEHDIWHGIDSPLFTLWWPSQLQLADGDVSVLARYGQAHADAFSSDINVMDGRIVGWPDLERRYGILLDPARLCGEPGVVEGRFGDGKVILSLVHFDTPGDRNGAVVLRNLWRYLASDHPSRLPTMGHTEGDGSACPLPPNIRATVAQIEETVAGLIAFGGRNLLWYWRNPLLLQWRRGVRGLEYSTLAVMIGEIVQRLGRPSGPGEPPGLPGAINPSWLEGELREIRDELIPFVERAKALLARERFFLTTGPLSPLECADAQISRLREDLFGSAMSHSGRFKRLIGRVDELLFRLIREE